MQELTHTRKSNLGEASLALLILRYTPPAIISVSVAALYNLVDTIFIGRYVGELAVAASTVALPIMLLTNSIAMWIGAGGTANGALRLGEGRQEETERFLGSNLFLLVGASILVTLLGQLFLDPMLSLCGVTDVNYPYSKAFISVFLWGSLGQFIGIGMNNFIRVDGAPNVALFTILSGGILNIVLNIVFVAYLGWGVSGSALATVCGQSLSSALVLLYFISPWSMLKLKLHAITANMRIIKATLQLGLASFAIQLAASIVNIFVNAQITRWGALDPLGIDGGLATIGAAVKIAVLFVMPIVGISIAIQPILGFNYGARKFRRVERTFLIAWASASLVVLIFWIIIQLKAELFIGFFKMPDEWSTFAASALRRVMMFMPLIPIQVLGSNYFQSTGQPLKSTFLSLTRQLILFLPLIFIIPRMLQPYLGISPLASIVLATPLADACSVCIVAYFLVQEFKSLRSFPDSDSDPHERE